MALTAHETTLLERAADLDALDAAFDAATGSGGRLMLVAGEAGVGKTVLLRRFCARHAGTARILWGECDGLFTLSPLGPLVDISAVTGGELADLVADGAPPHAVAAAVLRDLAGQLPAIVVFEDVHWADDATLDVLRLLSRRVSTVPALRRRQLPRRRARPRAIRCGSRSASSRAARRPTGCGSCRCRSRPWPSWPSRTASTPASCTAGRPATRSSSPRRSRRRRRAADDGPRRRAGARRAAQPARAAAARRRGDRARDGRAARCSKRWPATRRAISRSVCPAACSARPAQPWRSGTTSRASPSRRRSRPTGGWRCTAGRSPRSPAPIRRGSPTTPRAPATATRCGASRPRPRSAPRRPALTAKPPRSMRGRCASATASSPRPAPRCTSAARRSASSSTGRKRRSPSCRARSSATAGSVTLVAKARCCARCRASSGVPAGSRSPIAPGRRRSPSSSRSSPAPSWRWRTRTWPRWP